MAKDTISVRNTGSLIVLIILSSTILSSAATLKQDTWISILAGAALSAPLILVYCRIVRLFPGMDLYSIIQSLFGRVAGFIITLLMTWYPLHLAALVLRDFTEFTVVVALQATPRIPIMILILSVAIFLAKNNFRLMGRWSVIVCAIVLTNLLGTLLLSLDTVDVSNLYPVAEHSFGQIASDSFTVSSVVFSETVVALAVFGSFKNGESPYKAYLSGLVIGAVALTLIILRDVLVLGPDLMMNASFPSYMAVRILRIGSFLERIESIVSFNLVLIGVTKIAICLSAASMGVGKLLNISDHTRIILPVSFLALALCTVLFESIIELMAFVEVFRYYALPFQAIIPLIIWLAAELKNRRISHIQVNP